MSRQHLFPPFSFLFFSFYIFFLRSQEMLATEDAATLICCPMPHHAKYRNRLNFGRIFDAFKAHIVTGLPRGELEQ
jgi:hypothetical protein